MKKEPVSRSSPEEDTGRESILRSTNQSFEADRLESMAFKLLLFLSASRFLVALERSFPLPVSSPGEPSFWKPWRNLRRRCLSSATSKHVQVVLTSCGLKKNFPYLNPCHDCKQVVKSVKNRRKVCQPPCGALQIKWLRGNLQIKSCRPRAARTRRPRVTHVSRLLLDV